MSYPVYYVIEGDTLPHLFDSFDGGTGASITLTGLAAADIEIYKDGGVTQRSSDAGYTLLDTDGIDFDGITGIHGFSIDLSDNTDAGFYTVGPWYHVVISSVTVDSQTVNFVACAFRILDATRGMAGTALPDAAADAAGGLPISDAGGLDLDTTDSNVSAILTDTGTTLDGKINTIDSNVDSILVDTGTTLQAELDGIQADTEDIQSRLPAALVGGRMDSNASAISGATSAADRLEAWTNGFTSGTVEGTPTTTVFDSDVAETSADHFNNSVVSFTGGNLLGQARRISDYDGTAGTFTVQPALTEAPGVGDTFIIVPLIALALDENGRTDVGSWLGTAVTLSAGAPDTNVQSIDTGAISSTTFSSGAIDAAAIATDAIGAAEVADALYGSIKKNTAFSNFMFTMRDSTDQTPKTGLTVTGQRSIDAAAFAGVTGTIAEIGNGVYQFDAAAADTNGDFITWKFTSAGADQLTVHFKTVS